MKKIILSIILITFAILGGSYVSASYAVAYTFDSISENNINHTSITEGLVTYNKIEVTSLAESEYYLFKITELDGTNLLNYNNYTLNYSEDVTIVDPTNSSFNTYINSIQFYDNYENYTIFKTSSSSAWFEFETYSDFNYTLLKRNYFLSDQVTATSSVVNDLSLVGNYITNQVSDDLRILSILYGNFYNTETIYIYVQNPELTVITDFSAKTSTSDVSFDVSYVSSYETIQKYRVSARDKDVVEKELAEFTITGYNTTTSNFSASKPSIAEQIISFVSNIFENEKVVDFSYIEEAKKTVRGETYYFDFNETSTWLGNAGAERSRLFYVLFDFYADDNLVSEVVDFNSISVSYDVYYERTFNQSFSNLLDDAKTEYNAWKDAADAKVADYVGEGIVETIVPETYTYRSDSLNESVIDYFRKWFQTDAQRYTTYEINTISSRYDVSDEQFKEVDFLDYNYCLYYGATTEGDFTTIARERFVKNFATGWFDSTEIEYAPLINNLTFLEMDFVYENQNYTVKIDNTDMSYMGQSDKLPGADVTTPDEDIFDFLGDLYMSLFENVMKVWDATIENIDRIIYVINFILVLIVLFIIEYGTYLLYNKKY